MANVTQGLFGFDPAQRAQQNNVQLQQQATAHAQLSPVQAARASLYRAGSQIGGGVAGLLGVKDPELEAQALMQQTAKTLDLTDHAAVRGVAKQWLQSGNTTLQNKALQLNDVADKAEENFNTRTKEKAANELAARKAERQVAFSKEYAEAPDADARLAITRKYADMPELIKMDEAALARKEKYEEAKRNDDRDAANRKELQAERLQAQANIAAEGRANRSAIAAEGKASRAATREAGENYKATLAQEKINNTNEKQADADAKADRSAASSVLHADRMISDVKDMKTLIKYETTGRTGQAAAAIHPGGEAGTLRTRIATIKANIGFDRLQQMREESPTGGALGQVAVQEIEALQSTVGSFSPLQSDAELRRSADKAIKHYENWKKAVTDDAATRKVRRASPQSITLPTATQRDAKKAPVSASGWGKAVEK